MRKKLIPATGNAILHLEITKDYAAELIIANKELALQVIEREKRAVELNAANKELAFQNLEKEKRAAELVIVNKELVAQLIQKERRASELIIANKELAYQNKEKANRAAELAIANIELAFQNKEKAKRASELITANKELAFQNLEKERRAAELVIANKELLVQLIQKEKRASELITANKELAYQNKEKANRAAELAVANIELAFQNKEKEKRAAELLIANKELEAFTFISSHDLQEPLRKIQIFSSLIFKEEYDNLSVKGKSYVERTSRFALHMQTLINDLLVYSRVTATQRKFEKNNLTKIIKEVMATMKEELAASSATIEVHNLLSLKIIPFQFRQLLQNLIANSIKFRKPNVKLRIVIKNNFIKYMPSRSKVFILKEDYFHISIRDNGIGFHPQYKHKIFDVFQRVHEKKVYEGTGIGLTIARKIVENHNGIITANGKINHGATFDIYIPASPESMV